MASALDEITVLDITQGMAGALATMFLCDNGARVIRIEAPGSDRMRHQPGYRVWDRGKERIHLDLLNDAGPSREHGSSVSSKSAISPHDIETFHGLVERADVLVESFAPSSGFRSLIDYDRLISDNPRLVQCFITAYGREGPVKNEPAIDDLVMARVGVLASLTTFRQGPPHVVHPLPSIAAGLLAAQGITASLLAREKTGRGRVVETSLMAGALLFASKVSGDKMKPLPFVPHNQPTGGGPFYSVFECSDGQWVQLGCIHGGFIDLAAVVLDIVDVVSDPKYGDGRFPKTEEARSELFDIVAGVMKTRPSDEWERLFEDADIPYARACTIEEAIENSQVRSNGMVIELEDPEVGPVLQMGLPIELSATPGRAKPVLGVSRESPAQILASLPGAQHYGPNAGRTALDPPLKGVKVVEISNVIAGPSAGKMLADLGADVIKLESLNGDISRPVGHAGFLYINSNKRSVSVEARTDHGKEVSRRLAAQADVLLANLRPGATDRIGLATDVLKKLNPGLIETHVTAYGRAGPYAHRPGVDPLAQALTGLQREQGGPGNPPVPLANLAATDFVAGAMGALGAVMALFVRERTGLAQRVDTNLLNAGILIGSEAVLRYEGKPPRRLIDKGQYGLDALHRLYQTKDGWIYLVAETEEQWGALCKVLDSDDLCADTRFASAQARRESRAILDGLLEPTFWKRTSQEWLRLLGGERVPCAPVVDEYSEGFFSDPQAVANDMIGTLRHPTVGQMKVLRNAVRFRDTADIEARPTPLLGEHTHQALQEVGYSERQIEELYRKGVVKTEEPSPES